MSTRLLCSLGAWFVLSLPWSFLPYHINTLPSRYHFALYPNKKPK